MVSSTTTLHGRLDAGSAAQLARHLRMSRELEGLLGAFEVARVPVMPLKGPVLAETLYAHPALRPYHDLDLLVRPDDRFQADALLRAAGHRPAPDEAHSTHFDLAFEGETVYLTPGGARVDLHWRLMNDPRFCWNERASLDLWDRAVPIRVGGRPALGLGPEDLLLYLAMHLAVHHGLVGPVWYRDLALLLEKVALDWETVLARAMRWRVRAALYFALRGLERFLGVTAPPGLLARLRPRGPRAALLHRLLGQAPVERLGRLGHFLPLLLTDRGRDLAGSARRVLWPSPAWLRARYGGAAPALPGQYLAHCRRLGAVLRAAGRNLPPPPQPPVPTVGRPSACGRGKGRLRA